VVVGHQQVEFLAGQEPRDKGILVVRLVLERKEVVVVVVVRVL
jgi:hypothetical protein